LNKLLTHSKVLKSVEEVTISHLNSELDQNVLLSVIIVESHVVEPIERLLTGGALGHQSPDDIALMHTLSNQLLVLLPDFLRHVRQNFVRKNFQGLLGFFYFKLQSPTLLFLHGSF